MKKRLKKFLCLMLCAALLLPNVPLARARESRTEETYDIYPVVREIEYDGTRFHLAEQVNVVYETGIDDATKAYLSEVLTEKGIDATVVSEPVEGAFNILLGIHGSGGAADAYAAALTLKTDDLYDRYDGYLLEAKDKQITIVGGDRDGAFYAVATLKMMLSSFEDGHLLGAQIEDYAGTEYRGFVEASTAAGTTRPAPSSWNLPGM